MIQGMEVILNSPLADAILFALGAHMGVGQVRKYTGEPYIVHPIEVAGAVAKYYPNDLNLQRAAILHDVVEDTEVTNRQVRCLFGDDVADLVGEVTDVSKSEDGNRKLRKAMDREHLSYASARGQTLKVADMISNHRSIIEHDPEFAIVFMKETELLYDVLTKAHKDARRRLKALIDEFNLARQRKEGMA